MDHDGGSNVELLETSHDDNNHSRADSTITGNGGADQSYSKSGIALNGRHSNRTRWLPFTDMNEALAFSLLPLSIVPILLLALFAPRLASKLSRSACLPNGEFIIPGTASIWNPAYIFTITITVGGERSYVRILLGNSVLSNYVGCHVESHDD